MTNKLKEALSNIELSYSAVVEIADDILKSRFKPINDLINEITVNMNSMPTDLLRDYLLKLQLFAYNISELRDKSAAKAELATAIQKEAYAIKFNSAEGAATVREKLAQAETATEQVAEVTYNLVAGLVRTKLDQCHRLVDCLKSVLMSRMQEFKFANMGSSAEIPQTLSNRINISE